MGMNRDENFKVVANGNAHALAFLHAYARWAHWVDDVKDMAAMHEDERETARQEGDWLLTLTANPFFLAHRDKLVPMILAGLNAWAESHKFPPVQRDVIKGIWHEAIYCVALITGGPEHQRRVSWEGREYDLEEDSKAIEAAAKGLATEAQSHGEDGEPVDVCNCACGGKRWKYRNGSFLFCSKNCPAQLVVEPTAMKGAG